MVIIYGIKNCPSCINAKKFCKLKKIEHKYIEINNDEIKEELIRLLNKKGNITVPQIFHDSTHIGSYRDFRIWFSSKKLSDAF